MLPFLVLGALLGSLTLTPLAVAWRSWPTMAVAALLSLLVSLAAMISIGPFLFLLTCLQGGSVVAFRSHNGQRGWSWLIWPSVAVWAVVVGLQFALIAWQPRPLALSLLLVVGGVAFGGTSGRPYPRRHRQPRHS